MLVGFHGYGENAEASLAEMLTELPGVEPQWTVVAVQALHRFYRGRTVATVASWMTRQDRGLLIADNVDYVRSRVAQVPTGAPRALVFLGFSQGVAMAYRAAVRGRHRTDLVLALGGDVPPELLDDPAARFPRTLLARGARDQFFGAAGHDRDTVRLRERGALVEQLVFEGGHEWTDEFRLTAARLLTESALPAQ